jgi:hypothetical protein
MQLVKVLILIGKSLLTIHPILSDQYNRNWLYTEYQTDLIQCQHASNWQKFLEDKDVFKNLKYNKTPNEYHRHEKYDGIILPVDHPDWDWLTPQLDWGCECYLTQTNEKATKQKLDKSEVPKIFQTNPGRTAEIFNQEHPYFHVSKNVQSLINSNSNKLALKYKIEANRKIYNAYKKDGYKVLEGFNFNDKTGGFVLKHAKAQALKPHEKAIVKKLHATGERVVLPEYNDANFNKNFDAWLNESMFEFKSPEADSNIKKRIEEHGKEANKQANNVLFDLPLNSNLTDVKRGLGNLKKLDRLNAIVLLKGKNRTVITMKEIRKGDYSALDALK